MGEILPLRINFNLLAKNLEKILYITLQRLIFPKSETLEGDFSFGIRAIKVSFMESTESLSLRTYKTTLLTFFYMYSSGSDKRLLGSNQVQGSLKHAFGK